MLLQQKNLTSIICFSLILFIFQTSTAQNEKKDTLISLRNLPEFGGYGEASFSYNDKEKTSVFDFTRAVITMNYRFNENIQFFSEFELESAGVEGESEGGEFALEQAYLEYRIGNSSRLLAGIIIPRIGYTNEYHLPHDHFSVDRPMVETLIIPTTWREIGVSLRGTIEQINGIEYQVSLLNGLNAAGFEYGSGFKHGSQEGRHALGNSLAIHGALTASTGDFRYQLSGYLGGSVPYSPSESDSLNLESGPFGCPVALVEADIIYEHNPWEIRVLGTIVSISEAEQLNRAFAGNVPEQMWGAYAELAYNILHNHSSKKLQVFARIEQLDLNSKVPDNGISNEALTQSYFSTGLHYQPVSGVSIKADYTLKSTGEFNSELAQTDFIVPENYYKKQGLWKIGIGYSF